MQGGGSRLRVWILGVALWSGVHGLGARVSGWGGLKV